MNIQPGLTFREQLGTKLGIKSWVGLELFLVTAVSLLRLFHPFLLVIIVSFSFWARRQTLQQIGLGRPKSWVKTLLIGLGIGIGLAFFGYWISLHATAPGISRDLGQFSGIKGNWSLLLGWLAFNWSFTVILEEVVYRAYLICRVIDIVGDRLLGWITALLISGMLFGVAHLALQDMGGAISTFISGTVYGSLYLLSRRKNLWVPILVHGTSNTIAFLGLFLGWI
jgi:membrane protease YdiL (CAAX protease family)